MYLFKLSKFRLDDFLCSVSILLALVLERHRYLVFFFGSYLGLHVMDYYPRHDTNCY